jgi:hypothetical protein
VKIRRIDVAQRSDEWWQARCGLLTSSVAADVFREGRKKNEESYQKRDLRIRIALERITDVPQDEDTFVTREMQRGIDREGDARRAYEALRGEIIDPVGFLACDDPLVGTSPDGLVGEDGGVEVKCPKSAIHIGYLKGVAACLLDHVHPFHAIPNDYLFQMRHHLWVTDRQWWDFVSFDDRMPEPLQLCVIRLERDHAELPAYNLAIRLFLKTVDEEVATIRALQVAA